MLVVVVVVGVVVGGGGCSSDHLTSFQCSYKKWLLSEIDPAGKIFPPGVLDRLASYQDVCDDL